MVNLAVEQTLADVVNTVPGSARVLESFGLDYCCGGRRPLGEACTKAGVDPQAVLDALSAGELGPEPSWAAMTPTELVDHLEATHHAYLHTELERLETLSGKVASSHGDRHPELLEVRAICAEIREDLEPHMMKEERVLFPMIRELADSSVTPTFHCGSVRNPISMMMLEHEHTGVLLEKLRALTDGYQTPRNGCASYRALYEGLAQLEADTHLHIHKENNLLFPAVVALEEPG
jgi:regulator of cell morphogenesis and NO signaling